MSAEYSAHRARARPGACDHEMLAREIPLIEGTAARRRDRCDEARQVHRKGNLGSDGRSERREAVVGDGATRRALKVERGHADLSRGDRLDGFEGEDEHLRVGR